jgi:hypothetical protein
LPFLYRPSTTLGFLEGEGEASGKDVEISFSSIGLDGAGLLEGLPCLNDCKRAMKVSEGTIGASSIAKTRLQRVAARSQKVKSPPQAQCEGSLARQSAGILEESSDKTLQITQTGL